MPSTRPKSTAGDYLVLAISPALIMALIGSLIFFLIEILYAGAYPGSLRWTLFFYVFGAVLVARIALTPETASLSGLYGGVLGLAAWLALLRFVKYPPDNPLADFAWLINAGLILLIWWCAYRLTWDCTYVDETVGVAGLGVLQAAGLEEKKTEPEPAPEAKTEDKDNAPAGWLERWRRYSERKNQRRTPGVWVVWFGLAALVLFGLGQALIPPEATGRRRYVFWLMILHVASGLGLLSTTCFLGLRNYLREKKLQMPAAMVGVWLATGVILIGCFLALGALLPRPSAEYKVVDINPLGAEKRDAAKQNVRDGDAGEGEGKGQGQARDRQNSDGKSGNGKDKKGEQQQGNRDRGQGDKDRGGSRGQKDGKDKQEQGKSGGPNQEQKAQGQGGSKKDETEQTQKELKDVWKNAPKALNNPFLRNVVFIAVGIIVAFFVLRALLRYAANFTHWADNLLRALDRLWQSILALFGRKGGESESGEALTGESAEAATQDRPFSAYANPFATGQAKQLSPTQLARYTFAAFEAWARENDLARQAGETPLEFAQKVALVVPALEREAETLAHLLTRALYAPGELPASALPTLEQFWDKLLAVEAAPLSA